jgi:hypothetical protein
VKCINGSRGEVLKERKPIIRDDDNGDNDDDDDEIIVTERVKNIWKQ